MGDKKSKRAYWLVLAILVVATGLLVWYCAGDWRSYGYILVLGVPFSIGCVLGLAFDVRRAFTILSVLGGVLIVVALALTFEFSGLFCALILAFFSLGPLALGMLAGLALRLAFPSLSKPSASNFTLSMLLLLLPLAPLYWEAQLPFDDQIEVVTSHRILSMSPQSAWDSILFYEEVPGDPPLLARLGLPRPLRTEGVATRAGDFKRCLYSTGHLLKRITRWAPPGQLSFVVVEQRGIEDRSMRLIDGGFELQALGPQRTRLTVTTRYRPRLQARLFWRPVEAAVARALHSHVIDGMEKNLPEGVDQDYLVRGEQP